ncbi:hypothetical protein Tco_1162690 [Tanacetum coccineum]
MSSITAQQTKLDLELVPKEKRLEIGKCNGRLNPGKIQREPTFQVVLDALALTSCYSAFLITADVPEFYMHQFWDSVYKHDTFYRFKMDKRKRFKLNLEIFKDIFKICPRVHGQDFDALHTDEEIVSFLRDLVSSEEPMMKSKRVKRPAKKSTKALTRGVVIRETPEMPLSKKEKVDVARGTGVKPGVPDVTEEESSESEADSWGNDEDDNNNKQDSRSEGSDEENDSDDKNTISDNEKGSDFEHETDENGSDSEFDHQENKEEDKDDEEEKEEELVKTPYNDSDDEGKITDKAEGDEDEEMDYTTSQLYDDVDIRLNEPVDTDKGFIQEEGTDAEITNILQGNENPEISQVIENAHVTLSTVPQKTEVLVTSSSLSSYLAAKFLNFLDIPHTDAEIVSPMDVHVYHEVPNKQTPTLLTVPVLVITDTSPVYSTIIPQSLPSFAPPPQQSTSTPPQQLMLQILHLHFLISHQSSNSTTESQHWKKKLLNSKRILLKLKKTSKDKEPTKGPKDKESQSGSSKGTKSQPKSFRKSVQSEEPEFKVADSDMPQDPEENPSNDDEEPKEKVASKHDWFTKPTQPQEPTHPD